MPRRMRTPALIAGIAVLFPATGAAQAEDRSLRFIEGWYCRADGDVLQPPPPQRFYKRGFCKDFRSNNLAFTRRGTTSLRDVECKFSQVKKIRNNVYWVHADCIDSHSVVSEPEKFTSFFELEILAFGLLLTDLFEG